MSRLYVPPQPLTKPAQVKSEKLWIPPGKFSLNNPLRTGSRRTGGLRLADAVASQHQLRQANAQTVNDGSAILGRTMLPQSRRTGAMQSEPTMDYPTFFLALFELVGAFTRSHRCHHRIDQLVRLAMTLRLLALLPADKWTTSIDAEEYIKMLAFLLEEVGARLKAMRFGEVPTPVALPLAVPHNHPITGPESFGTRSLSVSCE